LRSDDRARPIGTCFGPGKMIDIHSHILWGVDDGAATLDDSLAMLRMAAASGTTDIVATPHANSTYPFDLEVLTSRYQELAGCHRGLPRIHRGCDFHLSAGNIHDALDNPAKYTISGGRYLMVELPEMFSPASMDHALQQLWAKGMIPVVTHPERNMLLQRKPEMVLRLAKMGCAIQLTANSFTGRWGSGARKMCEWLIEREAAHIVASDAHDLRSRPPVMAPAREVVRQLYGYDWAEVLFNANPEAVIYNKPLPFQPDRRA